MNFALSSSHTRGSSSKRVLILQADELEQSHTPHQRAELVRQLRERSAIAPSFALIWAKLGQKKQSYVPGAGELDFHSCAVSQLLVGRRHRFDICVPETQSPLEVLCINAPPAGRENRIRGPIKRITNAAPRAYESDHQ